MTEISKPSFKLGFGLYIIALTILPALTLVVPRGPEGDAKRLFVSMHLCCTSFSITMDENVRGEIIFRVDIQAVLWEEEGKESKKCGNQRPELSSGLRCAFCGWRQQVPGPCRWRRRLPRRPVFLVDSTIWAIPVI